MGEYNEKYCQSQHEAIKEQIETHERRLNDHSERLKKIENDNVGTSKDIQNFKDTLNDIKNLIEKMTFQLENLKEKPAKRWDGLVDKIITVLVGLIIGRFLK